MSFSSRRYVSGSLSRAARALGAATLAACLVTSVPAFATPTFPTVVQSHLGLATEPACTLCHSSPGGGKGTAVTPFALALRSRGLEKADDRSLRTALDALAAARTDSDGDGVPDIEGLKSGKTPNATSANVLVPEYGCAAAHAPARTGAADALVSVGTGVAGILGLVLSRRRRRGDHALSARRHTPN